MWLQDNNILKRVVRSILCARVRFTFMCMHGVSCLSSSFITTFSFRLQKHSFVLMVELHKWLERVEKENRKIFDRKTLIHTLDKLQQEGTCKCIKVNVPVVTNYAGSRSILM